MAQPRLADIAKPPSGTAPARPPVAPCRAGRRKPARLKRRADFLQVAGQGNKAAVSGVVLQARARGDGEMARLGFTVTKKVGNAVIRNRTRRRLREAARLLIAERPCLGHDLVLIGRDSTRRRRFDLLIGDIRRALDKVGVP